ncbi:MAG: N-acetylmuramoyl-L-alanine amidase [Bacteroidetes bacterium]|nr:N-acetylmuramoyl-L-alanine amidase [Bacteroidota bacterium]
MKTIIKILILLLTYVDSIGQNIDIQSKIKYNTEKAQNYLDKEKLLSGFYSNDADGIKMYASPKDKLSNKIEFFIRWEQIENFNNLLKFNSTTSMLAKYNAGQLNGFPDEIYIAPKTITPEKKLIGYKIALDPGHIANDLETGDLEKKYLKIKGDRINGIKDSIEIAEGMLTDDLKNAVDSLYKIGELKASQKQYFLSKKANDRDIFRVVFKDLELAKRAEIINNFHPDLTVVIHFNVDETNLKWEKTSNKDFNMTFVAGAFMKNDLSTKEKRFEFLRLLISDNLERSISLSSSVVKSFENELKVPTATIRDAKYLIEGCVMAANGVYCRNLQLPRYIHSPIVYGETLYQDNINECKALNAESDKTKNKRVQQIAEAYFKGILEYTATLSEK